MACRVALALFALCLLLAGSSAQQPQGGLVYKVSPSVVVDGVSPLLTIDCKSTPDISDLDRALMMAVFKDNVNGTSMMASIWLPIIDEDDGRVKVEGKLQSEEDDGTSFLEITVQDPSFEDEGVYTCRFIYLNSTFKVKELKSIANVTVEAVLSDMIVPPVAAMSETPTAASCDCEDVREEINDLKDLINAKQADAPVVVAAPAYSAAAVDGSCQVSFSAHYKNQYGQPILSDHLLKFNEVVSNKGNAYSTESGLFSAPCDGQYFFTLSLKTQQEMDSGYVEGIITVDDEAMATTSVFSDVPLNHMESASNSVVVSLKQGQKVKVVMRTTSFGQIIGSTYSMFSGFFLFP